MSDKEVRAVHEIEARQERLFHDLAQSGELENAGGPSRANDQSEHNPNSQKQHQKKRLKDQFLEATLQVITDMHNQLIDQINQELDEVLKNLAELENRMQQNRNQWENNGQILNDIDDLYTGLENGGELDREKAYSIMGISDNNDELKALSHTQIIELLEVFRNEILDDNESLETKFDQLERSHKTYKERQTDLIAAKTKLVEITGNTALSTNQKMNAITSLSQEVGTNTLHAATTGIQDEQTRRISDQVFLKDREIVSQSFDVKPVF